MEGKIYSHVCSVQIIHTIILTNPGAVPSISGKHVNMQTRTHTHTHTHIYIYIERDRHI